MLPSRSTRNAAALAATAFLLAAPPGCAHRREAYYPGDVPGPRQGVRVRAPFVDVQVQGRPKTDRDEKLSRRDRDVPDLDRDEDDDRD